MLSASIAVGFPQAPVPSPSEIHVWPESPTEEIPYSTLLADSTPSSTRSVRFESIVWYDDSVS